jgi:hypothetical protein
VFYFRVFQLIINFPIAIFLLLPLDWLCSQVHVLKWVHTCNVTAYHNAVTLQETDTIQSYELKFHPVLHGVTVFCEHYTLAFPVCYGSEGWW